MQHGGVEGEERRDGDDDDEDAGSSFFGEKECSLSSSSGKGSSMSPHNSMEGSPRMLFSPSTTEVVMGKKTIRNYMPKESGNMLRELENQRKNRRDQEEKKETPHLAKQHSGKPEKKTSVERMIEDFHRNLPHPAAAKEPDGRSTATNTVNSKRNGALVNGTMTSQMSNWSAGSSVASFDYHQVRKIEWRDPLGCIH